MSTTSNAKASINVQPLPPSLQILLQKQQEHAGLQALKESSSELVARVEKLAQMSNIMADGGEAIGGVLRNWPFVFSILNSLEKPEQSHVDTSQAEDDLEEPLPQMIRLPYSGETGSAPSPSAPAP